MKKRIVTIALVVALLATCFAGTYAYLTDTDAATNVMTLGNVDIEQIEQERDADIRKNLIFSRKYYLAALTDATKAVKINIGA